MTKKDDVIHLRVTEDVKKDFFDACEERHITPSKLLHSMVLDWLEKNPPSSKKPEPVEGSKPKRKAK